MKKVKIQDLQIHPELRNLKVSESQIQRMSFLLEKFGQYQPILVRQVESQIYVVDGLIRFESAKHLQWEEITVQEVDWQSDLVIENRCLSGIY